MSQRNYSAAEIARALGIEKRSANRRAEDERWPFLEKAARGGRAKLYPVSSLPPDVRRALHAWEIRQAAETHSPQTPEIPGQGIQNWLAVGEVERAVALARLAVLRCQADWVGRRNGQRGHHTAVVREFYGRLTEALRCAGGTPALQELGFLEHEVPGVLAHVKKVSWQTAYRWQAALQKSREQGAGSGVVGLARKYNWDEDEQRRQVKASRRGYGAKTMTPEMVAFVRTLFVQPNNGIQLFPECSPAPGRRFLTCNRAAAYKRLQQNFPQLPHPAHFSRWLNQYLAQEGEGLAAICLPSWWQANCAPKAGCASENVEYFGQKWEMDGTSADVWLADGRYEVVNAVEIFARDALVQVEKHAAAITVAKLMHRGILAWGVPEEIKTDRGLIFKGKHIDGACKHLGIDLHLCQGYAAWQKPHTEAFNYVMSRTLFEMMPWYIGHNPMERKRIEEFGKFNQVFYHKKGVKVSCDATAEELRQTLEHWLAKVYRVEPHKFADTHLGRAPVVWKRQAQSPRWAPRVEIPEHLDALLAPSIERVFNSGVQWLSKHPKDRYAPDSAEAWQAAQPFARQMVIFKPSLADAGQGTLWARREDGSAGDFICRVDNRMRGGMDLDEYMKATGKIKKIHKKRRKAVEQLACLPGYDRELARMPMPKVAVAGFGAPTYDGDAYRALRDHDDRFGLKLVADQGRDERIIQEAAALAAGQQKKERGLEELKETPEVQRYVAHIKALAKGEAISGDDLQFQRFFEVRPDYHRLEEWFKEIKMQAAMERWD